MRLLIVLTVATTALLCTVTPVQAQPPETPSAYSITLPPHPPDPPRNHLLMIDMPKLIMFLHVFYMHAITDHIALGGAVQTPTSIFMDAHGIGMQPEITYTFNDNAFDGAYMGFSMWLNYLDYAREETIKGVLQEVGRISEFGFSIAPTLGFYSEGPANGPVYQVVAGPEYNVVPTTRNVAGTSSAREKISLYLSVRMGWRF